MLRNSIGDNLLGPGERATGGAVGRRSEAVSRRWVAACAAALVGGVMTSTAAAQTSAWHGNANLRPVPQVRSSSLVAGSHAPTAGSSSTQRPGWNLQWRTSPQIAAQEAREISDAAFAEPPAQPLAVEQPRSGTYAPRLSAEPDLQRVAWTMPQTESPSGGFALPSNELPSNEFRGPATSSPAPQGPAATSPSSKAPSSSSPSKSDPSLQAPNQAAAEVLPPPAAAPSRSAPRDASSDNLESLFGFGPTPEQRSAQPKATPAQPSSEGSSIRGMLGNEPATSEPGNLQVLPPGVPQQESEESPSDLESFAPNPFQNRDANRGAIDDLKLDRDQRDRDRLNRGDFSEMFGAKDLDTTSNGIGLSCDEFRERIRNATIDKVSLDPSPPFRPEVTNMKEFEELKDRFNADQSVRTWRNIDGRPMGTGRLNDLAYEKAVIQTDFGTTEELPLNQLSEADLAYISQNWGLPAECLIEQVAYAPRQWTPTTMTYAASNLCHKPLYFQEVNLERYGHTAGPLAQPIISSAHFFLNIAVLPYKMGVHSPHECQYALGYYRPGNCAPWIVPPVPLSVKGAWYQATAVTGTALLIP